MKKPFIIADVGSNWQRPPLDPLQLALRHIDDAAICGVSAVKFQLFTHQELYGVPGHNDYELPIGWLHVLASQCVKRHIEFMCTGFSVEGIKLIDRYVNYHKIASSEMMDLKLLETVLATGKPCFISTGDAHQEEIIKIRDWLLKQGHHNWEFLNCVAKYPAETHDYNLSHMWGGISDHTLSSELAIAAVGRGALTFEKHYDALADIVPRGNNIGMPQESPDGPVSIGPTQLRTYVDCINRAYQALHIGEVSKIEEQSKAPSNMKAKWRRRLKVIHPLKGGQDVLQYGVNYGSFRSLSDDYRAASPMDVDQFEGKRVKKDMQPQDGLWFDDIE